MKNQKNISQSISDFEKRKLQTSLRFSVRVRSSRRKARNRVCALPFFYGNFYSLEPNINRLSCIDWFGSYLEDLRFMCIIMCCQFHLEIGFV